MDVSYLLVARPTAAPVSAVDVLYEQEQRRARDGPELPAGRRQPVTGGLVGRDVHHRGYDVRGGVRTEVLQQRTGE